MSGPKDRDCCHGQTSFDSIPHNQNLVTKQTGKTMMQCDEYQRIWISQKVLNHFLRHLWINAVFNNVKCNVQVTYQ